MAKVAHLQAIMSAVDRITPTLKRINTRAGMMHKTFRDVGSSSRNLLAGIGVPATLGLSAIGFGFVSAARGALEFAGALQDVKENSGLSIRAQQELAAVFEAGGVAQAEFTSAAEKLNKGLAEAGAGKDKSLLNLLTSLRIPLRDAKGQLRSVEEILPELADDFERIKNPAVRSRMAMELFGKSGGRFIGVLAGGGDAMRKAREEASRLGAVLSDDATGKVAESGDAIDFLGRQLRVQMAGAFAAAAPAILKATRGLTEWIGKNKEVLQQRLGAAIERMARAFSAWVDSGGLERLFTGIENIVTSVAGFVRSVGGMQNVLMGLGILILAGPVASLFALSASLVRLSVVAGGVGLATFKILAGAGLTLVAALNKITFVFAGMSVGLGSVVVAAMPFIAVAVAIAGAAYLIYRNWDTLAPMLADVWDDIKTGVFAAWQPIQDFILGVWNRVSGVIDKITSGARAVAGLFGGEGGDVGGGFDAMGNSTGASPLVSAGALQAPTARMQAGVQVSFVNAPPGMRVQGGPASPGLDVNVDVGRRSTGSIG